MWKMSRLAPMSLTVVPRLLELHDDLGAALPQRFARAQVDRDALPPPVVDVEARGRERLRLGLRIDILLLPVAGPQHLAAVVHLGAVLAAHHVAAHLLRRVDAHGLQQLGLLVADGVGLEGARHLHAEIGQHLEHVVLHHVAQHAGGVVVAAAALDVDRLRDVELDVVDVVLVPQRLEHAVAEAEGQ